MLGKLSVALLIIASPALAQDAAPAEGSEGASVEASAPAPVAYRTKRVCRSVEVVGSSIPRTTCRTKKIPIKPVEEEAVAEAETAPDPASQQ